MLAFLIRRVAASLLLLVVVLTATFFLLKLSDGDPVRSQAALSDKDPAFVAAERARLGLDRPLVEQYVRWVYRVVVHGDWGTSYRQEVPAMRRLLGALPDTVWLTLAVLFLQHLFGFSLGIAAAVHHGRPADHAVRGLTLAIFALPLFWVAKLAIEVVGVHWGLLPFGGTHTVGSETWSPFARVVDYLRHLALPALVLALTGVAAVARLVRNSMIEVLGQDYIRAAHARGLSRTRVLWLHALPNTLGPVIQRLGVNLPTLLSGALVTEVIFSWPGIGRVAFDAMQALDYPVILAATALSATLVVLGTLLADLLHAWLDPRIREHHVG